ncbi:hypothetical protein GCM10028805_11360 [Spirosoma harenae]
MKNYQYLKSGILEAHLLGLVTEEEKQELERLLATDDDILSDLSEIEMDLEAYFLKNSVPPPPDLREKIELRISQTDLKKWEEPIPHQSSESFGKTQSSEPNYVHVEVDNTHIRVHKHWKVAFIAVFILSKVFLILGLYFYFKATSLEQEVNRLKTEVQQSSPLHR